MAAIEFVLAQIEKKQQLHKPTEAPSARRLGTKFFLPITKIIFSALNKYS